jgi:glycosyltransferase involved in cell wall biosynthesis
VVQALRTHCLFYVHGHQVGGTNPSLLEAMGAGNAVLAHDNPFNRWVVGPGALYFRDRATCTVALDQMLSGRANLALMRRDNQARVGRVFVWEQVLGAYASLLAAVARQAATREPVRQDNPIWKQHTT